MNCNSLVKLFKKNEIRTGRFTNAQRLEKCRLKKKNKIKACADVTLKDGEGPRARALEVSSRQQVAGRVWRPLRLRVSMRVSARLSYVTV